MGGAKKVEITEIIENSVFREYFDQGETVVHYNFGQLRIGNSQSVETVGENPTEQEIELLSGRLYKAAECAGPVYTTETSYRIRGEKYSIYVNNAHGLRLEARRNLGEGDYTAKVDNGWEKENWENWEGVSL